MFLEYRCSLEFLEYLEGSVHPEFPVYLEYLECPAHLVDLGGRVNLEHL